MEGEDMFPSGPLSFDSNLDGLIDVDFNMDLERPFPLEDLERPFPSQYSMSAHVNEGADMIVPEGVGVVETSIDTSEKMDTVEEKLVNVESSINTGIEKMETLKQTHTMSIESSKKMDTVRETFSNVETSVDATQKVDTIKGKSTNVGTSMDTTQKIDTVKETFPIVQTSIGITTQKADTLKGTLPNVKASPETSEKIDIVEEKLANKETSIITTQNVDTISGSLTNGLPVEKMENVSQIETENAGSAIRDTKVGRVDPNTSGKKVVAEKTIDKIEQLNLAELKEKRRKKLAQLKNRLIVKEASKDKPKTKEVNLVARSKKRKHEDSFRTTNEASKKIKDTNEVAGSTKEISMTNGLDVNMKDAAEPNKNDRGKSASMATDTETMAAPPTKVKEEPIEKPVKVINKTNHKVVPENQIQGVVVKRENVAQGAIVLKTDIQKEADLKAKGKVFIDKNHGKLENDIDEHERQGTDTDEQNENIQDQLETAFIEQPETFNSEEEKKKPETVIQKNQETDIYEQPKTVIQDNLDIYKRQGKGFDKRNNEIGAVDGEISEGEIVSEAEVVSESGSMSEGELISEGEIVSEAEITSEAEGTSEGELGEIISEQEFHTDIDDELDILDELNEETDASDIQETTLMETDQTSFTDTGLDKDNDEFNQNLNDIETSDTGQNSMLNNNGDMDQSAVDKDNEESDQNVITDSADNLDNDFDNDNDDDADDESDDFDDNDVDAWLEAGVEKDNVKEKADPSEVTSVTELGEGRYISTEKHVLEEKGTNHFDVLPEDWVMILHYSGMPVYLHRPSRVCTMSRPYFIGKGSARRHDTPVNAIPCLQYRRELEKESKKKAAQETSTEQSSTDQLSMEQTNTEQTSTEQTSVQQASTEQTNTEQSEPQTKAEPMTPAEVTKSIPTPVIAQAEEKELIGATELYNYCKGLFHFRSMVIRKFLTWKEKRSHLREKYEQQKKQHLPKVSADAKLIVCPIPEAVAKQSNRKRKEFLINPDNKSAICILHEYTQHVLKVQPVYNYTEIENNVTPYKATIKIGGIGYGSGVGRCKRQAKAEAAKQALVVFIPKLAEHWKDIANKGQSSDLAFFEDVTIEDPRVADLCEKAALPKPYQVLTECLRRNYGMGDTNLQVEKRMISNQKTEFSLSVGKHTATVVCKNKIEGKQKAAQAMLQKLHPQLKNWASILRLYSKRTEVGFEERQEEEIPQQAPTKDVELLDKLKEAMRKARYHQGQKNTSNFCDITPQQLDL